MLLKYLSASNVIIYLLIYLYHKVEKISRKNYHFKKVRWPQGGDREFQPLVTRSHDTIDDRLISY